MRPFIRSLLVVSLVLASTTVGRAQTVDPTGHWEGAIEIPGGELPFQVDLSKNAKGELIATYGRPDTGLKGLPLTRITVDGRAISFVLTGNTTFTGVLYADGNTISGDVAAPIGSAPFSMTRTGEAVIAPPPRNPPIARELEGTWNATISLGGEDLRLVLQMTNQPDGTSVGTLTSVDRGGLVIPLAMTQTASTLTLSADPIGKDFFAGSLTSGGELAGTFTQGPVHAPLTFQRAR
jgi:hypothetical protein